MLYKKNVQKHTLLQKMVNALLLSDNIRFHQLLFIPFI